MLLYTPDIQTPDPDTDTRSSRPLWLRIVDAVVKTALVALLLGYVVAMTWAAWGGTGW